MVYSVATDASMTSIKQFMAGRGRLHTIVRGNGTIFVGSAREVKEHGKEWNQIDTHDNPSYHRLIWKLNSLGAPLAGGIREGLLRSCEKAIYSVMCSRG